MQNPMDMESFQAFQTETCERTKAALWTVWVGPRVCISSDSFQIPVEFKERIEIPFEC